ncbi:stalk domain-containing protein [Alkalihalophilus marmarensis]|uniref:D-alanyl-D-alanine carboxypeptidase n=1 Tax=Alkalihalophilus marmarensis DSM 21297 TaxID=1188261 RepID=U6SMA0_9BACI|nr:stalk domain-containing protein [Alkalihalophilus marmarensis]ERN52040.1 hypothetical protein A33I_18275 [Alkalihalophilus marmarensis DSM 21297]
MNRLKQAGFLFLIVLLLSTPMQAYAFNPASAGSIKIIEQPYFIQHQDQAMLADGQAITYQGMDYLPLRDIASLFNLGISHQGNGIYLEQTGAGTISIQPSTNRQLPKQTIPASDLVTFNIPIGAHAGVVLEDGQQTPSFAKNANAPLYPASTVKVMTALLALEHGNLNDVVVVGPGAAAVPSDSSTAGVRPGDIMTLEQLLYALMLPSGNDAAVAIAEHIGGSHWQFIQMMNQRARQLGAVNTTFSNAHGYPHPNQKTTVNDLAKIGQEAAKHPFFLKLVSTPNYATTYRNRQGMPVHKAWRNTNAMTQPSSGFMHPSILGGKTGYTNAARHNLISFGQGNGYDYTIVLLRGEREQRYRDTRSLIDQMKFSRQLFDSAHKKTIVVSPVSEPLYLNQQQISGIENMFIYNNSIYIPATSIPKLSAMAGGARLTTTQQMQVKVNQDVVTFDRTEPVILSGRLLVPVRSIFEELGLELEWNAATQTVTGKNATTTITMKMNDTHATVNGIPHTLDVPATAVNGRTIVPVRFITEATGATVDWGRGRVLMLN